MVRIIAFFVGLGFAGVLLWSFVVNLYDNITEPPAPTAEHEFHREPKELHLASDGPFGKWDKAQLQRGFQVYKEVCAACHSLERVAFRDLAGLGYNEAEIKAIAKSYDVPSINPDTGEPATRKGIPADYFPKPYANETAGRAANNNAYPPDLSLITKAREGGAAYIYSLLTGYQNQPTELLKQFPDVKTPEGLHYNPYFANLNIAMPKPIVSDGQVTYGEGAPAATVDQMAKDVSAFLVWTAEPKLVNRHRAGMAVLIFLIMATVLGYMAYQNIWASAKRKVAPKGPLDPDNQAKREAAKAEAGGIAG
ncbi:cytochrome c1 [Sphingomonas rhizophila]|uniref:Cytochrome c1 n=1 Tax=Sphingomonas rhizophila TaxID=2071607 RepID=A0A7G9S889_9SPHN|nr:cytochrome c1 [Sphingomonas rhizophila]QNN64064.1 cytochrome c1 [Sphingomonas rhizophila]